MGGRTPKYRKDISSMYKPRRTFCSNVIFYTYYILTIKSHQILAMSLFCTEMSMDLNGYITDWKEMVVCSISKANLT